MQQFSSFSWILAFLAVVTALGQSAEVPAEPAPAPLGARGSVGCGINPTRVERLSITRPGTYENMLVDGHWTDNSLVKINADNVTLRNCEIRNGKHNAVTVYARDVTIESCKIHHVLAGTYEDLTGTSRDIAILIDIQDTMSIFLSGQISGAPHDPAVLRPGACCRGDTRLRTSRGAVSRGNREGVDRMSPQADVRVVGE